MDLKEKFRPIKTTMSLIDSIREESGFLELVIKRSEDIETIPYDFIRINLWRTDDEKHITGRRLITSSIPDHDVSVFKLVGNEILDYIPEFTANPNSFCLIAGYDTNTKDREPKNEEFQLVKTWKDNNTHCLSLVASEYTKKRFYWFFDNIVRPKLLTIIPILNENKDLYVRIERRCGNNSKWYYFDDVKECFDYLISNYQEYVKLTGEQVFDFDEFDNKEGPHPIISLRRAYIPIADLHNLIITIQNLDNTTEIQYSQFPELIPSAYAEYKKGALIEFKKGGETLDGSDSEKYELSAFNKSGKGINLRDVQFRFIDGRVFISEDQLNAHNIEKFILFDNNCATSQNSESKHDSENKSSN